MSSPTLAVAVLGAGLLAGPIADRIDARPDLELTARSADARVLPAGTGSVVYVPSLAEIAAAAPAAIQPREDDPRVPRLDPAPHNPPRPPAAPHGRRPRPAAGLPARHPETCPDRMPPAEPRRSPAHRSALHHRAARRSAAPIVHSPRRRGLSHRVHPLSGPPATTRHPPARPARAPAGTRPDRFVRRGGPRIPRPGATATPRSAGSRPGRPRKAVRPYPRRPSSRPATLPASRRRTTGVPHRPRSPSRRQRFPSRPMRSTVPRNRIPAGPRNVPGNHAAHSAVATRAQRPRSTRTPPMCCRPSTMTTQHVSAVEPIPVAGLPRGRPNPQPSANRNRGRRPGRGARNGYAWRHAPVSRFSPCWRC